MHRTQEGCWDDDDDGGDEVAQQPRRWEGERVRRGKWKSQRNTGQKASVPPWADITTASRDVSLDDGMLTQRHVGMIQKMWNKEVIRRSASLYIPPALYTENHLHHICFYNDLSTQRILKEAFSHLVVQIVALSAQRTHNLPSTSCLHGIASCL